MLNPNKVDHEAWAKALARDEARELRRQQRRQQQQQTTTTTTEETNS